MTNKTTNSRCTDDLDTDLDDGDCTYGDAAIEELRAHALDYNAQHGVR